MVSFVVHASLSSIFFGLFGVSWDSVDRKIAEEFPSVRFISTDDLMGLTAVGEAVPRIFDVREADEYSVSHLAEAINFSTAEDIAAAVPDKEAEIVVYCSVGYRSAAVADELKDLGYSNVRNLQHSLFEWAEKDFPMVNSQGDVDKVHPYNRAWGTLLDKDMHQYPQ